MPEFQALWKLVDKFEAWWLTCQGGAAFGRETLLARRKSACLEIRSPTERATRLRLTGLLHRGASE